MESTASRTVYGAPDRGRCAVCGRERPLAWTTGYIKRHRNPDGTQCPGGGRAPARPDDTETVELPD